MYSVVNISYKECGEIDELVQISDIIMRNKSYTPETLIEYIETAEEEIIFISNLSVNYAFLEPYIIKRQWQLKTCDKTEKYKPYTVLSNIAFSNEILYTIAMFGEKRKCQKIEVRQKSGHIIHIYDYENWKEWTEAELNELIITRSTPAAMAREKIFGKNLINCGWKKEYETQYKLLLYYVKGGIIKTSYRDCFFETAYHYDITSLYPYILSLIYYWPNPATLTILEEDEQADHLHYAYFVTDPDDGSINCNVYDDVIPAGSWRMNLNLYNSSQEPMNELFEIKNNTPKGSAQNKLAKKMLNSAIGSLIQHTKHDYYHPYMFSNTRSKPRELDKKMSQFPERYLYLIARSHYYVNNIMIDAEEQGARILQFNTDGFFTDIPIKYDQDKFLGSLRFEYQAHNLTIFACNQYACDEEVCIAGLNKEHYIPGVLKYRIEYPIYSPEGPRWAIQLFTLGGY